ncbi:MAG TPA: hypothetical protein VKI19_05505 [Acidimicrobiales bacterium]|nr:hypothetical protein [Acidimicrobiales bacterium]
MGRVAARGVSVVAAWAVLNGVLASLLFVFDARDEDQERAFYLGAVAIVAVASIALFFRPSPQRPGGRLRGGDGGAAPAFAAACLIGGLAWVFGVFLAYFALPLLALVAGRLWAEWKASR